MTKQEFIEKWDYLIPEFYHVELAEDFNSVIKQAIAEHEASQWKKYSEEKPERRKAYLVQYKGGGYEYRRYLIDGLWPDVIAFREPPKPYQEGGER